MVTYKLNINFNNQNDLDTIYAAHQSVTVLMDSGPDSLRVVWHAFEPFCTNTIVWTDECQLYCSMTSIKSGEVVTMVAQVPRAEPGMSYTLAKGHFVSPTVKHELLPDKYEAKNDPTNECSRRFGLAQAPKVNGQNINFCPVWIENVPNGNSMIRCLSPQITVFLRSHVERAMIIDYVRAHADQYWTQSGAITLTFSASSPEQSIRYDSVIGKFVRV